MSSSLASTVWFCQHCNWKNSVHQQNCGSCGCTINGEFKSMQSDHSDVVEQRYFYHDIDPSHKPKGPFNAEQLSLLYLTEQVNDFTYLWNGTTIKKWTILHKTSLMKPNAKTKLNRVIICESIDNPKASRRRKLFQNKSASSPKTKSKQIKKNGLFRFFSSKKGFGGKYDQVLLLQN
eukprot:193795_1